MKLKKLLTKGLVALALVGTGTVFSSVFNNQTVNAQHFSFVSGQPDQFIHVRTWLSGTYKDGNKIYRDYFTNLKNGKTEYGRFLIGKNGMAKKAFIFNTYTFDKFDPKKSGTYITNKNFSIIFEYNLKNKKTINGVVVRYNGKPANDWPQLTYHAYSDNGVYKITGFKRQGND